LKIHFDGAAQTVTGSQFLLEVNSSRLLLECGLFQGPRAESTVRNLNFPFNPQEIDAVVLSHAHMDHSGNLPNLVKQGYNGPIYATPGTVALSHIMLQDSGHIHEADAEYVNRKREKRGEPPVEPLYTILDAEEACQRFQQIEYDKAFEPVPGVKVRFVEAGHILGAAAVVLDIAENGRKRRLWFSGDIGRMNLPLVRDPVLPENADFLMMECTYGDKPHRDPDEAYKEFAEVVKRTVLRRGKVIIPAFAVGRTQEIVYQLNRMFSDNEIPHLPVYVDSPLAVSATDVFRLYPRYFDEEAHQFVRESHHPALSFDGLTFTRSVEESKAINNLNGPLIIISASGMAETGRILHHLKNNIEDPRNTVMIVSWQAPNTLGRRLADQETRIRIFGEDYIRRAEVVTIGGLSAHAGQDMLLKYALSSQQSLKQIFLVHGEERGAEPLMEKIRESGFRQTLYPILHKTVEI
jgi:metallo-beta-lactamase family protein